jgi:hypothetical protein
MRSSAGTQGEKGEVPVVGVKKEKLDNSIEVKLVGGPNRGMTIRVYPDTRDEQPPKYSPITLDQATYGPPQFGMDPTKPIYVIQ